MPDINDPMQSQQAASRIGGWCRMRATLPNYDPYGGHNIVYAGDDLAPTILLNAGKGYPPLIIIEEVHA